MKDQLPTTQPTARLKVLIACECSGAVRTAFRARGHDAWSCDVKPCSDAGPHIQGDALDVIKFGGWDLMIAHPPCTFLSVAGNAWLNRPGRKEARAKALEFFIALYNAPVPRICVENPAGYPCSAFRAPDQQIHPYYFGESQMKRTLLWLKNLPPLVHVKESDLISQRTHTEPPPPTYVDKTGKNRYFVDSLGFSKDRQAKRSVTFAAIANAMAEQWGSLKPLREMEAAA
jgi:hypothetical protein